MSVAFLMHRSIRHSPALSPISTLLLHHHRRCHWLCLLLLFSVLLFLPARRFHLHRLHLSPSVRINIQSHLHILLPPATPSQPPPSLPPPKKRSSHAPPLQLYATTSTPGSATLLSSSSAASTTKNTRALSSTAPSPLLYARRGNSGIGSRQWTLGMRKPFGLPRFCSRSCEN